MRSKHVPISGWMTTITNAVSSLVPQFRWTTGPPDLRVGSSAPSETGTWVPGGYTRSCAESMALRLFSHLIFTAFSSQKCQHSDSKWHKLAIVLRFQGTSGTKPSLFSTWLWWVPGWEYKTMEVRGKERREGENLLSMNKQGSAMLWRLTFIFIVDFYLQALVWCVQPRIASQHSTEWRTIVYPIVCSHRTSVCIILKSCEPALYYMAYDCILKAFRGFSILRPSALRHKLHRVTYVCTQLLKPSFCAPAPYCLAYDCTPKAGLAWCICSLFSIFVEIIRIFVMVKVAITRWRIFKLLSSLCFVCTNESQHDS